MPLAGWTPALEKLVRSVPPAARIMVEARIETGADLRQRLDQWQQLDSPLPGALELLSNGGIRIKAATANGPASNVVTASARSKNDLGAVEPFMDPLVADAGGNKNRLAALVSWAGSESPQVEVMQILANLNPQFDLTRPKVVARWRLDLFRISQVDFNIVGQGNFRVQPLLLGVFAPAAGQTAGLVTFDFTTQPSRPRPKLLKTDGDPGIAFGFKKARPHTLALIQGLDRDGKPATNIGWGYDGGAASQVSAAGSTLSGQRVKHSGSVGQITLVGSSASVPAIQFILATHAGPVTTGFTGAGNQITLPAATPEAQIELVGRAEVPPGTSVLYEVQDDAAVWRAHTDGQTLDTLAGFAGPTYTTLKQRVTLTPNTVGDRSPLVLGLGARAVKTQDLSDVCEVQRLEYLVDPQDLHSEVPDLVLRAIHDGERDFRDAITRLLSENPINALTFRLSIGHPTLPRSQWLHVDDFPILEDYDLGGPDVTLQLQSPLVLVRGVLPKLSPEVDAYPIADVSNPGAWTKSAATTSFFELLADNQGGIGFLPWDDSTYVVSPNNPTDADLTVQLGGIGAPNTLAGVHVQFRYAMLTAQGSVRFEVTLMEGATPRATVVVRASGTSVQQGDLLLTGQQIASIQNWGNLSLRLRAGVQILVGASTGQVLLTWARLAVLPQRAPLVYNYPRAIGEVATDLLANQVGLEARYRGPTIVDAPLPGGGLDLPQCLTVGKTITAPPGGGADLLVAKQELDALGDLAGGTWTSEQGRVVFKPAFDVSVDPTSGVVTYTPRTPAPVAVIPSTELQPIGVTPGFKYRVPVFDAFGGYDDVKGSYALEAHGTLPAPLLSSVGPAWLVARRQLDDRSARWIQSQAVLNARALRQIQTLGLGQLAWRFRTTYARPEVSVFDVVALETDRFIAYDPSAARAIAGLQWVLGFVVGKHNVWGTELTVWIPSYASIGLGAVVQPASQGPPPNLASVFVAVTVVPRAGGFLQVTWSGSPVVQSIRLAAALQADGGRPLPLVASGLDEAGRLTSFASAGPGGSALLGGASGATPFQGAAPDGAALGSMPSRLLGLASSGQPPAEAGGVYVGRTGAALLGQYYYQDVVLLTVTPYLTPDGSGPPGVPELLSVRVDVEQDQHDPGGGRLRRDVPLDDTSRLVTADSVIAADAGWTQANARPGTHTQQLLPNFGFEDGLAFWVINDPSAGAINRVITDAAAAKSGNRYLKLTSTTGDRSNVVAADDAGTKRWFEVSPGDVVQWGGWVYRESGTDNCQILLQTADKDQVSVANYFATNNTAAWVLVQGQLVIPAGIKYVALFCDVEGNGTATVARFDDLFLRIAFGTSPILNAQGSILPTPVDTVFAEANNGALYWYLTWAAFTIYRPDGSTIVVPANTGMPVPPAPTLSQVAGGAIGATTYTVRLAYVKAGCLMGVGNTASLAVSANNLLKVASPPALPGYDGWIPLITTGATVAIQSAAGPQGAPPNAPIPFGTDWTEQTTGLGVQGQQFTADWVTALVYAGATGLGIAFGTSYFMYPYYDVINGVVALSAAPRTGSTSVADAQGQWLDGHIGLGVGAMTFTTPGGGSGGGVPGGGNGGRYK